MSFEQLAEMTRVRPNWLASMDDPCPVFLGGCGRTAREHLSKEVLERMKSK